MTAPLRVAYLTSAYARPSDTFIRNEVNELRRLGVDVATFSIRRPSVGDDADDDVRAHQRSTEYLLEAGWLRLIGAAASIAATTPRRFLKSIALAWRTAAPGLRGAALQMAYFLEATRLAQRLSLRKIQVLHNHIGENSATVAMLAAELSGVPFSLTIHGPYIFFAVERWALREKLARAAFTACITHFCRSQCLAFAPEAAWPRLHVVRCSVQPMFADEPLDAPPSTVPRFLCVGRLCPEKGQWVLIDAMHELARRGRQAQLTLVGDGPDRELIERRIREQKLDGIVDLVGWQGSSRVRELLAESRALVIGSFAEGLPVVAMEALAALRPVIATNIAAISELVEPGVNGWLVAPSSPELLADAMESALDAPEGMLRQMGAAGRTAVLERHHPRRQAEQLRALLASAAAGVPAHATSPLRTAHAGVASASPAV